MSPQAPPPRRAKGTPAERQAAAITPEEVAAVLAVVQAAVEAEAAPGRAGGQETKDAWVAAGRPGAADSRRERPERDRGRRG